MSWLARRGVVGLIAAVVLGAGVARATPTTSRAGVRADGSPARVMLDAGHGGSNPGAVGPGGIEKHLTLALTQQVAAILRSHGVDVRLTRERDRTATLRQRAAKANAWPADLYVSVHANASVPRTQRGFETYLMSERAVAIDSRALRADLRTARASVAPTVAAMLDDVEIGANQWEAAELALAMQARLRAVRGPEGDRGVKQDAHHVLLGATMPAVLVEVGFIDHPQEGRELTEPAVREQLAEAIAQAILDQLTVAK